MSTPDAARRVDLVILLHGVGSRGAGLAPIARAWARRLNGVRVVAPDGPFDHDEDRRFRQWYSIVGVTAETRAARVAAAGAAFDAVIDETIAEVGTSAGRTVLAGFSQGGSMALDALRRGRDFAGLLAMATRLAAPLGRRLDGFSARVVHGEADTVIAIDEAERTREALATAGARVDLVRLPGGGHGIDLAVAKAGLAFLVVAAGGKATS
ncbi:MAG: dienelactone hydrolase family protein [Siculibacillus sp.]|nr:dienelactone hydrolase family protein [Siculibacillus sp.]